MRIRLIAIAVFIAGSAGFAPESIATAARSFITFSVPSAVWMSVAETAG